MRARDQMDAARGCLLAGAVGDALGAAIEFMRWPEIQEAFGPAGLTDYAPAYGRLGAITDDTQMTLFTAEACIQGRSRAATKGMCSVPSMAWHSYQRWMHTQGERCDPRIWSELSPILDVEALRHQRAPGRTCLSALRGDMRDVAANNSKGCGGVMRVAPCGLIWLPVGERAANSFNVAHACAEVTHGHPTGSLTAGVLGMMVYEMGRGASLTEATQSAMIHLRLRDGHAESLEALEVAVELAASDHEPGTEAISSLGEGWVAEEALAIGLYSALVAKDMRHGLVLAVNHSGDSDSTGSIAGNLLGVLYGESAIPAEWLDRLECRDLIAQVGSDLAACMTPELDPGNWDNDSVEMKTYWSRWHSRQ